MSNKNQQGFAVLIVVAILALLAIGGVLLLPRSSTNTNNTIAGNLDINGVVPQGAQVTVMQREANAGGQFASAGVYPAVDQTAWSIGSLQKKVLYEVQAQMTVNGQVVSTSNSIQASAPATGEILTFNIASTSTNQNSTITGIVRINGYLPEGATLTIQGKKVEDKVYKTVVSEVAAKQTQIMTYSTAQEGQSYNVMGTLEDSSGNQIGQSQVVTVTAPAANELIVINSTAKAPAGQATSGSVISGTIDMNGDVPTGATIVVYQSPAGKNNYQVAQDSIQPNNGATWSWDGATPGVSYNIFATVKVPEGSNQSDSDLGTSNTLTVTAPATNQVLNIDTGYQLKGAVGNITITCNTHNADNTWNGTLNFQTIQGAQAYWFQLGTNNGGSDIVNQTQAAQNSSNQTINTTIKDSQVYYARYAYKNTGDLSQANFSPFSAVQTVKCPN